MIEKREKAWEVLGKAAFWGSRAGEVMVILEFRQDWSLEMKESALMIAVLRSRVPEGDWHSEG